MSLSNSLEAAGYRVRRAEKASYYAGMLRYLGGFERLRALRHAQIIALLTDATLRTAIPQPVGHLLRVMDAGDGDRKHAAFAHIKTLTSLGMLFRGVTVTCPHCEYPNWHMIDLLTESLLCDGCRQAYQLPVDRLDFSYRLNHLCARALNQGALSVLLTALALSDRCNDNFAWDSAYEVGRAGTWTEIDLVARCGDQVVIAECKDNLNPRQQTPEDWIAQLGQALRIAADVGAGLFVLAMLHPPPASIHDALAAAQAGYPAIPVNILSGAELLRSTLHG